MGLKNVAEMNDDLLQEEFEKTCIYEEGISEWE